MYDGGMMDGADKVSVFCEVPPCDQPHSNTFEPPLSKTLEKLEKLRRSICAPLVFHGGAGVEHVPKFLGTCFAVIAQESIRAFSPEIFAVVGLARS